VVDLSTVVAKLFVHTFVARTTRNVGENQCAYQAGNSSGNNLDRVSRFQSYVANLYGSKRPNPPATSHRPREHCGPAIGPFADNPDEEDLGGIDIPCSPLSAKVKKKASVVGRTPTGWQLREVEENKRKGRRPALVATKARAARRHFFIL
tara:strand:- start:848 stop:1297 length:450 start_codon:yes stop_codon:yes gene_type:complete